MKLTVTTKELGKLQAEIAEINRERPNRSGQALQSLNSRLTVARERLDAIFAEITPPLEDALRAVNGKTEAHTITSAWELRSIANAAEDHLAESGVTLKHRIGSEIHLRPGGPSAKAYGYRAKTTRVRLQRVTDGWRLIGAEVVEVYPKQTAENRVLISPEARDDVLRHAMQGLEVREDDADDAAFVERLDRVSGGVA